MAGNQLYFGDNLDVLRKIDQKGDRVFATGSIDLIYLDPPFNSKRDFNAFFRERDDRRSTAMVQAFKDTWKWGAEAAANFDDAVQSGNDRVKQTMTAFQKMMPRSDMLAYLSMMAPRLIELHRVLNDTGTLWLHCDPTASHYLKLLLDAIFGPRRFINEVTWKRSSAHSDTKQGMARCGKIHDVILVYSKTKDYTWVPQYTPYTEEYLKSEYRHLSKDKKRRFKQTDPTAAKPGGDTDYDWNVKREARKDAKWAPDLDEEFKTPKSGWEYKPVRPYQRRYWAYSKANLIRFWNEKKLYHRKTGMPRLIQYHDEMPGIPLQDIWDDIAPESKSKHMHYPTQKPEALLERIVAVASKPGQIVLDPFCGCGTAVIASERLRRKWIGIDVTHLAVGLIKHRLTTSFTAKPTYEVHGEPTEYEGAAALAEHDRFQFQCWAVGKLAGRPIESKKGTDRGVDGRLYFRDGGELRQIVISVKSGKFKLTELRDLVGVVERDDAAIGVLVQMPDNITAETRKEIADAKYYESKFMNKKYPKIQIITARELAENGKQIDCPPFFESPTHGSAKTLNRVADTKETLLPGFGKESS